jgi:hypothetical protein
MTDEATLKAGLEQLGDIAGARLDFLDRAIALGKSLTGDDDPRVDEFLKLIREECAQMPSLAKQLEGMLADLTDGKVAPLPDNTGK